MNFRVGSINGRSFMNIKNKIGHKTEPWGTSIILLCADDAPHTLTTWSNKNSKV